MKLYHFKKLSKDKHGTDHQNGFDIWTQSNFFISFSFFLSFFLFFLFIFLLIGFLSAWWNCLTEIDCKNRQQVFPCVCACACARATTDVHTCLCITPAWVFLPFVPVILSFFLSFLDAFPHLYKRVWLSVGPSVERVSENWGIRHKIHVFFL